MDIEQLKLRTKKEDVTKDNKDLAYMLERAGMQFRSRDLLYKTPFGLLKENILRDRLKDLLYKEGFGDYSAAGVHSLRGLLEAAHGYVDNQVTSYKDLPFKVMTIETIALQTADYSSLWKNSHQEVLLLSVLGEEKEEAMERAKRVFHALNIPYAIAGDTFYYEHPYGQQTFHWPLPSQEDTDSPGKFSGARMTEVETPNVRSIEELVRFLDCSPGDIIKTMLFTNGNEVFAVLTEGDRDVDLFKVTRILSLEEDALEILSKEKVMEITGAEPGFAGPSGLKVDKILVDTSVRKNKKYAAGANKTDYHVIGIQYGRDFSGSFYDLAKSGSSAKGWVLGEVKEHEERIRVQNKEGVYSYEALTSLYLNLDRLNYALLEECKDDRGFLFKKEQAPFSLVVSLIDPRVEEAAIKAQELYDGLKARGLRVLKDFRKDRLGSKFSDYDLMGIPYRILVAKDGTFDVKDRNGVVLEKGLQNLVEISNPEVIE